ncbi:hypothetical protein RCL1_000127 [Eukaryota sp. TZLM3-RCL]
MVLLTSSQTDFFDLDLDDMINSNNVYTDDKDITHPFPGCQKPSDPVTQDSFHHASPANYAPQQQCSPSQCQSCTHSQHCMKAFPAVQPVPQTVSMMPQMVYPQLSAIDPNGQVFYLLPQHTAAPVPFPIYHGGPYGYFVPQMSQPQFGGSMSRFMPQVQRSSFAAKRRGRPPKDIPHSTLKELVDNGLTQEEILQTLRDRNVTISSSTLKRRLAKAGLSTRVCSKKDEKMDQGDQASNISLSINSNTNGMDGFNSSIFLPGLSVPSPYNNQKDSSNFEHNNYQNYHTEAYVSLTGLADEDKVSASFDECSLGGFMNDFY